ncbi:hypothetical protein YC2023_059418 [Brassica napus]
MQGIGRSLEGGDKLDTFLIRYVFQTTLYALWRERNQRRHGEAATPSSHLTRMVDKRIRNQFAIFRGLYGHAYERGLITMLKPKYVFWRHFTRSKPVNRKRGYSKEIGQRTIAYRVTLLISQGWYGFEETEKKLKKVPQTNVSSSRVTPFHIYLLDKK